MRTRDVRRVLEGNAANPFFEQRHRRANAIAGRDGFFFVPEQFVLDIEGTAPFSVASPSIWNASDNCIPVDAKTLNKSASVSLSLASLALHAAMSASLSGNRRCASSRCGTTPL